MTRRPQVVNQRQLLDGFTELVDDRNRIGQWAQNGPKPDKVQFKFYEVRKIFRRSPLLRLGGVFRSLQVSREAMIDLEL